MEARSEGFGFIVNQGVGVVERFWCRVGFCRLSISRFWDIMLSSFLCLSQLAAWCSWRERVKSSDSSMLV